MDVDASASLAARGGWDRDVNEAVDWAQELPEDGGGGVAQDRAGAAGEDRGHEVRVEAQASVPHGVDALADAIQLPFANANRDRLGAEAAAFELPPRHDAVLPRCDFRYLDIRCVAFCAHMDA